ncbi:MAG: hypothetical protein CND89_03485 [Marine Group II euryarchaeote MED-G38]|nr:hypothetical protein [Euryarchaeota archaeon]PDH22813.1 MAG: hypothetical protein CND89_03485 [Marine Group II euryarchaeote MED-G38]
MSSTFRHVLMGLLDELIFDFLGLESPTLLELIFAGSAVIGGGLFLFWFALVMIGGITADIFDGVFGTDIDAIGADASFKALTFQGIMAFLMFFGLGGLFVLKSDGGNAIAIVVGGITGFASMVGTGKLFEFFIGLQADGTVNIASAVNAKGTVYLGISEENIGQVQVNVGGTLRTYPARSFDKTSIDTGVMIQVKEVVAGVLIVERI